MLFLVKILKLTGIRASKRRCKETPSISFASILLKKSRIILHLLSFLYLLLLSSALFSQNLVPNPSFEEKINFQDSDPANWIKCLKNDTPDHFILSNTGVGFNRDKFFGGTEPYDGNSCAGIFCYRVNPLRGTADVREFIQIQLKETLTRDSLYDISLYLCLDKESNTAINGFHVYFSENPVYEKHERKMYDLHPQVTFRKNYFDNPDWIKLEETYRARGGEKHIILGNFSSDKEVRIKRVSFPKDRKLEMKWNLGEKEKAAYYYIDQVRLIKHRESNKEEEIEIEKPKVKLDSVPGVQEKEDEKFELEKIDRDSSVILKNILFEFDKAVLLPESYKELNKLFAFMQENDPVSIRIEGHTDNIGSHEYNMELSLRRAEAVGNYLIKKGIDPERLTWKGYGKTRPVSLNKTDEGRRLNRRVAFRIIEE
jgi:outer membrane protein OmpA-like peptidoglycan-associated protein